MKMFLNLVLFLFCDIISASRFGDGHWMDNPHFFTIVMETRTWNDAREHCRSSGKQLLGSINGSDSEFWTEMLNHTRLKDNRSVASIYWTGLHAPDPAAPEVFFWDDCTIPKLAALVYNIRITGHQCFALWGRTETVFEVGMSSFMCNETYPFICMTNVNESDCVESCSEVVVSTEQDVCDILCENIACHSIYIGHLQMCHVIPIADATPTSFTLCYLPSVDFTPNVCTPKSDVDSINTTWTKMTVTDTNMNVTDTICMQQQTHTNITSVAVTEKCSCLCEKLWTFLSDPPEEVINLTVEEKIEIIVQELSVDKKNTTLSQRKYVSVIDYRPSSIGIGIVAAGIILSVISVIIIIDISTIWQEICTFLRKMFKMMQPPRSRDKNRFAETVEEADVTLDVLRSGDSPNKHISTEGYGDMVVNEMGGVGWFLRESIVYKEKELADTKLELASSETRKAKDSPLTSEV